MTRLSPLLLIAAATLPAQYPTPVELEGLWQAKLRFGPDVRGRLVIDRPAGAWRASIAGSTATVRSSSDTLAFHLPDGGDFVGRLNAKRNVVVGHWIQPRTQTSGSRFATPLTLVSCGPARPACYRGDVLPLDDEFTFYLKVTRRPDGSLGAFLRNPERNLGGQWIPVKRMERSGENVALLDRRDSVITRGTIRDGVLSIPLRGGTYAFARVPDTAFTNFYPRGRPTVKYTYVPPRLADDGWRVGTLREVGMSEDSIAAVVQRLIDMPIDSVFTPETHALLIARHGRLVLEEYFFGEHADKPHDTRSASKTMASALIGAARQAGVRIGHDTRVYAAMRPEAADLPPRKRGLTLEHLLTMSSGLDCDDNDDRSPGKEGVIARDTSHPDWARRGLDLDVVREPGDTAIYCSIQAHLAGSVLAAVTRRSLHDVLWELVGEPLQMRRYHLQLTPTGDVYWGGGHRYRARDFMKLAQLYLNGGTWNGRRLVSREWIDRSIEPRYRFGTSRYGYLWWVREYPFRGRTVKAYYAVGNGAQVSMWIPELDLAIASYGANYNAPTAGFLFQQTIPRILQAIEPGQRP